MHLSRSVCIMPATYSQHNQGHPYQRGHGMDTMNHYDQMSTIMRSNSTQSDGFGGAGTAKQFPHSNAPIKTNTAYNYDYGGGGGGDGVNDDDDGIKYLDTINSNQQHSTFYLHSNGNIISDKSVAIGATGYRSQSPQSSISDSGSSMISNSNSSTNNNNNNNQASFPVEESTTRSFCASSRSSNSISQTTFSTNNEWLKQPNKINDIVNNNDDEDDNCRHNDWIHSNSNVNVSNQGNDINCIDTNYANNNQPNRRNNSRTSRRTSSLRVYH